VARPRMRRRQRSWRRPTTSAPPSASCAALASCLAASAPRLRPTLVLRMKSCSFPRPSMAASQAAIAPSLAPAIARPPKRPAGAPTEGGPHLTDLHRCKSGQQASFRVHAACLSRDACSQGCSRHLPSFRQTPSCLWVRQNETWGPSRRFLRRLQSRNRSAPQRLLPVQPSLCTQQLPATLLCRRYRREELLASCRARHLWLRRPRRRCLQHQLLRLLSLLLSHRSSLQQMRKSCRRRRHQLLRRLRCRRLTGERASERRAPWQRLLCRAKTTHHHRRLLTLTTYHHRHLPTQTCLTLCRPTQHCKLEQCSQCIGRRHRRVMLGALTAASAQWRLDGWLLAEWRDCREAETGAVSARGPSPEEE